VGEWAIKFHVVVLIEPDRTHVAYDADDFDRHAATRDQQCFADWIFVSENCFRTRRADENYVRMIGVVLLGKITAGQKRDTECVQPAGRDVISSCPLAPRHPHPTASPPPH